MNKQSTAIPEGYRMTELGPLPSDWQVMDLQEVLEEVNVRVRECSCSYVDELPVLSLTKNEGLILQSERFDKRVAREDVSDYKVVERWQIVHNPYVIWEGAIHALRKFEYGLVSPVYPVWRVKSQKAVAYFVDQSLRLPHTIAAYNRFAAGAVNRRRSISKRDFLSIKIAVPPISEQKKIIAMLSAVEDAIVTTESVIIALQELKRSLVKHLFTHGPVAADTADQVELKESDVGQVPKHWDIVKLGEICDFFQYGTSQRCSKDDKGLPVLRIPNVLEGRIDISDLKYTSLPDKSVAKLALSAGDLLFVRTNGRREYVGRCAVYENEFDKALFASYLIRARLKEGTALPSFIQSYTTSQAGKQWLSGRASGASDGKFNINTQTLRNVEIGLPPLSEQKEIEDILSSLDLRIETEENYKREIDELFRTLLHDLMNAKIRVNNVEVSA